MYKGWFYYFLYFYSFVPLSNSRWIQNNWAEIDSDLWKKASKPFPTKFNVTLELNPLTESDWMNRKQEIKAMKPLLPEHELIEAVNMDIKRFYNYTEKMEIFSLIERLALLDPSISIDNDGKYNCLNVYNIDEEFLKQIGQLEELKIKVYEMGLKLPKLTC